MVGAVQVQRQVLNTQPTGIDHRCRRLAIGKGTLPAQRFCLEPWVSGAFAPLYEWPTIRPESQINTVPLGRTNVVFNAAGQRQAREIRATSLARTLLVAQSHHWVDFGGSSRGNQHCTKRDEEKQRRNFNVRPEVGGTDSEQEVPNEPHASQRTRNARHDTSRANERPLPKDGAQDAG